MDAINVRGIQLHGDVDTRGSRLVRQRLQECPERYLHQLLPGGTPQSTQPIRRNREQPELPDWWSYAFAPTQISGAYTIPCGGFPLLI